MGIGRTQTQVKAPWATPAGEGAPVLRESGNSELTDPLGRFPSVGRAWWTMRGSEPRIRSSLHISIDS